MYVKYIINMSLSLITYVGSKRTDIKFFSDYIPDNITTIVEPFGGCGYLSLYLYSKNPKIKCIVNDIDEELINFFNQIKKDSNIIIDGYNNLIKKKLTKDEFVNLLKEYKDLTNKTPVERAIYYLFFNKFRGTRMGMYPIIKVINEIDINKYKIFIEWVKNTEFTNTDYDICFNKYKNDKSVFMFLDPPYFDSFNAYYVTHNTKGISEDRVIVDNTKMYIDIIEYLKVAKCKILLIINKNSITSFMYKPYIVGEYDKLYQLTKNKTQHLIIEN